MGVAAAIAGGPLSIDSNQLSNPDRTRDQRGIPRATVIGALVTAGAFLVGRALRSWRLIDHSLATATLMVLIVCVAAASTTLAIAEIG